MLLCFWGCFFVFRALARIFFGVYFSSSAKQNRELPLWRRPEIARAKAALSKHALDVGPPDRQGGKSSRAELGGAGLTPLKATFARSAEEEEDPDEAVIVPGGEPPGVGDGASDVPNSGNGGANDARAPPPEHDDLALLGTDSAAGPFSDQKSHTRAGGGAE